MDKNIVTIVKKRGEDSNNHLNELCGDKWEMWKQKQNIIILIDDLPYCKYMFLLKFKYVTDRKPCSYGAVGIEPLTDFGDKAQKEIHKYIDEYIYDKYFDTDIIDDKFRDGIQKIYEKIKSDFISRKPTHSMVSG